MRDWDVRLAVRADLMAQHDGDADTRIVEEMGIWNGTVRVDLAVINGQMVGIELKSARDNLLRLPKQADLYGRVFNECLLVTAEKHYVHADRILPIWWGITLVYPQDGKLKLRVVRPQSSNPCLEPIQIARLLWKSEALSVLASHGLERGYRSAGADKIANKLAEALPIDTLAAEVRRRLKDRTSWLGEPVSHKRDMPVDSDF